MTKGEIVAETAVRFIRVLDGSPQKVWAFLSDGARLPQWYGDGAIQPHLGGTVTLMGGHIRGVVTGWRPQKFLAYTWSVFEPGEEISAWPISYVEFALEGAGETTTLTLTHRPIPEPMHKLTLLGWHTMLDMIEAGLKGEFPPRTEMMPKSAAVYGVDLNALKR